MNILNEVFYHNSEGEYIKDHSVIGDCISRNIFFILRHKLYAYKDFQVNDLYKAYLQNLSFNIAQDMKGYIKEVKLNNTCFWEKLVKEVHTHHFQNQPHEAMQCLKGLLEDGEVVLVETVAEKIKFHNSYHLDADINQTKNRKIHFLILAQEGDNLYYVYTYTLCNKKHFNACSENNSIGIAPKEDFYRAFGECVDFFTITDNLSKLEDVNTNITEAINMSIRDYFFSIDDNGTNRLSGQIGIQRMLEKCRKNEEFFCISSTQEENIFNFTHENFRMVVVWLCNRRRQYINLFERLNIQGNIVEELKDKLEVSISSWKKMNDYIKYLYFKGMYKMNSKGIILWESILLADDDLFNFINIHKEYLEEVVCNH